jgi:hypothetical protein
MAPIFVVFKYNATYRLQESHSKFVTMFLCFIISISNETNGVDSAVQYTVQ